MLTKAKKIDITEAMLQNANIPKRYWSAQIAKIKDGNLRNSLMQILEKLYGFLEEGKGIFVQGPPGVGKTAFACILLRKALEYGAYTFFVRAQELVDFYSVFDKKGFGLWDVLQNADVVVIDDLGKEEMARSGQKKIEYVLRSRYENSRCTIVTCALCLEALREIYPKDFISLLRRACGCLVSINNSQF